MGQAVDLPDPSQKSEFPARATGGASAAAVSSASADDLLSKLAGDEIDRMIAQADREPASAGNPAEAAARSAEPAVAPSPAATEAGADAAVRAELDTLFTELTSGDVPKVATPTSNDPPTGSADIAHPAAVATTAAVPAASFQPTVNQETVAPPAVVADLTPTSSPTVIAPVAPVTVAPLQATLSADAAATLAAPPIATTTATPTPKPATPPPPAAIDVAAVLLNPPHDDAPTTPWYLKPLELLNAPAALLSPNLRQSLGKVAIITACNAVAVLVYVLFIRTK